jgi:hypothetical protein
MKITETQLRQLIKEEVDSFFSSEREEEEASVLVSKRRFRQYRDETNHQIAWLQDLQRDKETLGYVADRLRQADSHFEGHFSQWQRMLAKLIRGLEQNLKIATGRKGTHSGATPLSEALRMAGHGGVLDSKSYEEWSGHFDQYHDSPKDFTDALAAKIRSVHLAQREYLDDYVSANLVEFIEKLARQTVLLGIRYR